ncbi:ice-binding family protein [Adhaeribacter pallidiroseus]|uniref:DUF11 domain-containing protein n=1 Tax=Adhaeribacter pallidiroseus TaxID=2072847 RepID=A0A369QPA6_9BACT|nr:ice-binding family protein [Adhaeribacter pallidiroseus]RDC64679.1 hypothetical protein AHMF7616_03295 [Adhaeribacter pallidiroseus]
MKRILPIFTFLFLAAFQLFAQQEKAPDLKAAQNFAVLGPAGITSTEETVIYADVAVTTGALTGFNPETDQGRVLRNSEVNNATAEAVQQSVQEAYDFISNQSPTSTHAPILGNGFTPDNDPAVTNGMLLTPGVYSFSDPNVLLSGLLRLNGLNRPDAVFIFKIEGNFTFEPGSVINLESGTQAKNVFFQIGGVLVPATSGGIPGANSALRGNYLVNNNDSPTGEAIRLSEGASVEGRLLAVNGSVTLQDNNISLANVVEADLSITKTSTRKKVPIGEEVSFAITVINYGPQEATNVEVIEDFPWAYMDVVSYDVAYQNTNTPGSADIILDRESKVFRIKLGNLKLKEKVVITVVAKALVAKSEVMNQVSVLSEVKDSNPTQDNAQVTVEIPATSANLYVTKTVDKTVANVGDELEYKVRVENLGPNKATNVTLTDIFPADYLTVIGEPIVTPGTLYSQNLSVDPISLSSSNLLTIGTLEVGPDKAVELVVNARIVKSGKIINRAEISNNAVTDPTSLNNRATVTTIAGDVPRADLQITKTASSSTVAIGSEITYTLTVRNNGPKEASGVIILDELSNDLKNDLKYVRSSPEAVFDNIAGVYTWNVGSLAVGAEASVTLTAIPTVVGQVSNIAKVTGNQVDLKPNNDVSQVVICVTPPVPVLVASKMQVCVGDIVTYSVENFNGVTGFLYNLPKGFIKLTGSGSTIVVRVDETAQENSEISIIPININTACANGEPLVVHVKVNQAPVLPATINGPLAACAGSEQTFNVNPVAGAETYTWTVPSNWQIRSGQNTASITVIIGTDPGTISVSIANSCGVGGSVTTGNIVPVAIPAVPVITDKSGPCSGLVYSINEIPGVSTYTWSVPEGFTILSGQGTTSIKVTADRLDRKGTIGVIANNANGCNGVAAMLEANAKAADANLIFPTAFTPNGDDKNETWVIDNLLKFPENEVQVINRWGNEVYRAKNYQNDWRANGLGEATYFYVLRVKLCDSTTKVYRGYITVVR